MAGERYLYFVGDKLPESTEEDDSTLAGKLFRLRWEMAPLGVSCIPPGNNLIFLSRNIKTAGDAC